MCFLSVSGSLWTVKSSPKRILVGDKDGSHSSPLKCSIFYGTCGDISDTKLQRRHLSQSHMHPQPKEVAVLLVDLVPRIHSLPRLPVAGEWQQKSGDTERPEESWEWPILCPDLRPVTLVPGPWQPKILGAIAMKMDRSRKAAVMGVPRKLTNKATSGLSLLS